MMRLHREAAHRPRGEFFFPLDQPTATQARTVELNKGRREERGLRSTAVDAEQVGFPFAAQVARVRRHLQAHQPEEVSLITDLSSAELDASAWLKFNRQAWGIEAGLHQRLDASHNDDRCRVLHPGAMLVFSLLRRLANSLFIEWQSQFPKPDQKTTTDFQSHFSEDHYRRGIRFLLNKRPHLKSTS